MLPSVRSSDALLSLKLASLQDAAGSDKRREKIVGERRQDSVRGVGKEVKGDWSRRETRKEEERSW